MSDCQKSPSYLGLSEADSLSPSQSSSASVAASGKLGGLSSRGNMEINTASTHTNITDALRNSEKADGKMFGGGIGGGSAPASYFLPGMMAGSAGSIPHLMNNDIVNQQLLAAQMQMLSFYHNQIYQKKLLEETERERLQKLWAVEQERIKEMEDQRLEVQKLTMIKQKPKEQESAIASNEVKLHLRSALMNKMKRNVHNQSANDIKETISRSWQRSQSSTSPPSSTVTAHDLGSSMSPPSLSYRSAGASQSNGLARDVEFPIRKTASEPNLKVKSMLKQKLCQDRRNSPLMARRRQLDKLYNSQLAVETGSLNGFVDHTTKSPPNLGSTPIISKEVHKAATLKRSFEEALSSQHVPSAAAAENLYISMPNISLGKSQNHQNTGSRGGGGAMSEAELRVKQAQKFGLPLTAGHLYQTSFQPSIAGISEDEYMHNMGALSAMHDARRLAHPYLTKPPSLNTSLDQQTLNVHSQRHIRQQKPLSRTQSAPLPIMHPAAAAAAAAVGGSLLLPPQQQAILEHQELVKQHQDQINKQHHKKHVLGQLRQALLQRSSSKNHMEQVDEESEARLIQEMQESREDNYESQQQKAVHSSHGSLYAATMAASAANNHGSTSGLDLSGSSVGQSAQSKRFGMRYLSRTNSSPLVAFANPPSATHPATDSGEAPINLATKAIVSDSEATGVVYDEAMLRHDCPCQNNGVHLENPSRIQSIWRRLKSCGLVDRCRKVESKKATIEQLQLCHTESYSLFFGVNSANRKKLGLTLPDIQFQRLGCGGIGVDADTVWNEEQSPNATRIAVGSVIELASRVYESQLKNGIAIVRPPGHHSEAGQAMGFCFFNSVAIAAKHLKHKLGASKILILDWDVHHGNGTQQMTYDDPGILYISLHRHDDGMFFPGTGGLSDCGDKQGLGFNVNIPFSGGLDPPMSDAEYMAAFRSIVMPIVEEFKPQITLVSAGFDGADGHANQLGGYKISPAGFGFMTKQLMSVCDNKVVLVLEGGYNLSSICDASEMCTRALLGENVPLPNQEEILRLPSKHAISTLEQCSRVQAQFWPMVANHREKINMSFVDALRHKPEPAKEPASPEIKVTGDGSPSKPLQLEPMEES